MDMIEIEPVQAARCAVIWLHGLGADGSDFEPLVRQWGLVEELGARFVLPHAPVQAVTLNQGMRMRAWYDIYDLSLRSQEDGAGVERAGAALHELVERELGRGIPATRILLAGFSQGGAVALHYGLRSELPLAGVLGLSTYLPVRERLAAEVRARPADLPVRLDHGRLDPVVPYAAAEETRDRLTAAGFPVEFHSYVMEHNLCPEQIDSLRAWLLRRLG